jgi:hypothetical protein
LLQQCYLLLLTTPVGCEEQNPVVDSSGNAQIHPVEHWRLLVQLPLQAAKPVLPAFNWTAETVPAPSTAVTSKANKPFLMNFGIGSSPFVSGS